MLIFRIYRFAVTAITECVRQELLYLGTKIKITSISPGLVEGKAHVVNFLSFVDLKFQTIFNLKV